MVVVVVVALVVVAVAVMMVVVLVVLLMVVVMVLVSISISLLYFIYHRSTIYHVWHTAIIRYRKVSKSLIEGGKNCVLSQSGEYLCLVIHDSCLISDL